MLRTLRSNIRSSATLRSCKSTVSSLESSFSSLSVGSTKIKSKLFTKQTPFLLEQFHSIKNDIISNNSACRLLQYSDFSNYKCFSALAHAQNQDEDFDNREIVTYVTLNTLADNPGAIKKKRRVGRGIGSSKGKTCGRGHKGQKARSGGKRKVKPGFEGGQTKLYKRLPKRGFNNKVHAEPMTPINLGDIQDHIDMKRLEVKDDKVINMKDLVDCGLVTMSSVKFGMKLLAKGKERFRTPIKIEVSRASKSAIEVIENVGGEITTVHYNRISLRALLKPHKFEGRIFPRSALPPPKLMTYYNDYENRGYLSPQVQKRKLLERLGMQEDTSNRDASDTKESSIKS